MKITLKLVLAVSVVLGGGLAICSQAVSAAERASAVTGIQAVCRNGQTVVTWNDMAEGEAGAAYRYDIYRSDTPIGPGLEGATRCMAGVLYNSAKMFGTAFNKKDRLDPSRPTVRLEPGGRPLPMWSGVASVTIPKARRSFYAVVATDEKGALVAPPEAGQSATVTPLEEKPGTLQPILIEDSLHRKGPYINPTCITGKKALSLMVELHASNAQGGGASEYGDSYLYFSRQEWGWMDGLPGVFAVEERKEVGNYLILRNRDTLVTPQAGALETFWFGYACVPQWASHPEPRAYNFTERRLLWIVDWVIRRYEADPNRVYARGGSMGAWGTTAFAFRHPEIFAAVYPNRPRTRQLGLPVLGKKVPADSVMMEDGVTPYLERMNTVAFAATHHEDLPNFLWCCGRQDGYATWQEQVDMIRVMTTNHHGFAFAWNNGNHTDGAKPMEKLLKYFGPDKFARNQSYPVFGNSSINEDPGPGDPKAGDMEGGINLGFIWSGVADEPGRWAVTLANDLCQEEMTVDVTPRRCQKFKPRAGQVVTWTHSLGGNGRGVIDEWGLVTVQKVRIKPGVATTLVLTVHSGPG